MTTPREYNRLALMFMFMFGMNLGIYAATEQWAVLLNSVMVLTPALWFAYLGSGSKWFEEKFVSYLIKRSNRCRSSSP